MKPNAEGNGLTTLVTSLVLLILPELEEKYTQMTCKDYRLLYSLVTTSMLTSYGIDLEARVCSCRRWHVTGIPYVHALMVLMEKGLPREAYFEECFHIKNFKLMYEEFFIPIVDTSQMYGVYQRHSGEAVKAVTISRTSKEASYSK